MLKTQCDKNAIPEGAALLLLPYFLVGDAEQVYQNELELGDEGVGGIASYCHAVQFILRRYAADLYIDGAVEEFENVRQKGDEDETAYARRLRSKFKCFGGVYFEAELITRSIRGLDPALRPLLSAELNSGLRSCRTFYDAVDRATGLGDSQLAMMHRATRRQKTTQNLRHRMDRVSLLPAQGRSAVPRQTRAAKMQSFCCKKKNQVQKLIICSYLPCRMERRTGQKFLIHRSLSLRKHPLRRISTPSTLHMTNSRCMSTILSHLLQMIRKGTKSTPMSVQGYPRR